MYFSQKTLEHFNARNNQCSGERVSDHEEQELLPKVYQSMQQFNRFEPMVTKL